MADFTNPFPGMKKEGNLDSGETIRALRLDVAAEEDATHLYTAQAGRIDQPAVKNSLLSVADEERVHAGEFTRLIKELDPRERQLLAQGAREVETREKLEHDGTVDMMVEVLLLHAIPEAYDMGGIVVNEERARTGPCTCYSNICFHSGIIGSLNAGEREQYCKERVEKSSPAMAARLQHWNDAKNVCKQKAQTLPKGERVIEYTHCMGTELGKRGIMV
jgi:rubrerythrin